jgi:pimeloyl-ACP methyl ester carboxylesterase
MRTDELDAAIGLSGRFAQSTVGAISEIHTAISRRALTAAGPAAQPLAVIHSLVATVSYGSVRAGLAGVTLAARAAARRRPDPVQVSGRQRGARALAAVTGAWNIEQLQPVLAPGTHVTAHGVTVPVTKSGLRTAFPNAHPKVIVFAHGLCETDSSWSLDAATLHPGEPSTAPRLTGWTPVILRYTTSAHISENGRRLDALLSQLIASWPTPVERVALVGHSMGGLVLRSALHQHATDDTGPDWGAVTTDLITLGSPHLGARLENLALHGARTMEKVPELRPVARALRSRSAGVKDLGHGHLMDTDWQGRDADLPCTGCATVPICEQVRHRAVAATITEKPTHPLSRAFGDLLVHVDSAHASRGHRRLLLAPEDRRHVGGTNHFQLLSSPRVDALLLEWLSTQSPAPAKEP